MRKLILEEWISLDGFAADKNGELDFFTAVDADLNRKSDEDQLKFLESIDTILLGRKTYELFGQFWPDATVDKEIIADKLNSIDKIVFSNTLVKAPWGKWKEAEVRSGNALDEIVKLKGKAGKDMVMWGSISLAQSLLNAQLVDEIHLTICPLILGAGRPLFVNDKVNLALKEVRNYNSGNVFLSYTVQH